MRAPVKGVEVERELETEKSFHGSVSELRKPVKANPAFVQFAWENEPHWMFVLFFSHFLFWLEGMPNYSGDASHFYSNGKYNGDGGIPSGGFGSGVFPISLILTVVSTVTVGVKAYHFKPSKFKKTVAK